MTNERRIELLTLIKDRLNDFPKESVTVTNVQQLADRVKLNERLLVATVSAVNELLEK